MRSSRERRIDRALSSVLDGIHNRYEEVLARYDNPSWSFLNRLEITHSSACIKACERAKHLHATWQRIVANSGE